MKAWFRLLKWRTLLLFSAVVAIVGLVPVLYLLGLVAWQFTGRLEGGPWVALPSALMFTNHALLQSSKVAPVLAYIPQLPFDWAWTTHEVAVWVLDKVHVGVVPALIGCVAMAVGVSGVLRERVLIRIHKERKDDRVRRIDDYRREAGRTDALDGRLEPFIGAADDVAKHAADAVRYTDRRVA